MISLELVPREAKQLVTEAQEAIAHFPQINFINVPDVLRLELRSWQAAELLLDEKIPVIPHIRAMDHSLAELLLILEPLIQKGLERIIIISGDAPPDSETYVPSGETPITLTQGIKKVYPDLLIYGALDPYRTNFKDELEYSHKKIHAGMDGLFSQPFFDQRLLGIYLDQLEGIPFFAGLAPVTSDKSIKYWERVNQVVFPEGFQTTLEANAALGLECLELTKSKSQHAYLMPIKISSQEYLSSLWGD